MIGLRRLLKRLGIRVGDLGHRPSKRYRAGAATKGAMARPQPAADESWPSVQQRCADVPGDEGIALRWTAYARFFQRFGRDIVIGEHCHFSHPERIVLEDGVRIGREALFEGSSAIHVGRNARIGHRFFVHSASHDVAPGPTAFVERGCSYDPVVIGDNVLIAANVAVMPGARIGDGSVVAANSLVPGQELARDSDIRGVPGWAIPRLDGEPPARTVPAPHLAFVVRRASPSAAAAELLATVLASPQTVVLDEAEAMPPSVAVVLVFPGAEPRSVPEGVHVWRFSDEGTRPARGITVLNLRPGREEVLPEAVEHEFAFNGFGDEPTLLNAARATMFLACNNLRKAPPHKRAKLRAGWLAAIAIWSALALDDARLEPILAEVAAAFPDFGIGPDGRLPGAAAIAALAAPLVPAGSEALGAGDAVAPESAAALAAAVEADIALLPLVILVHRARSADACEALIGQVARRPKGAARRAGIALANLLLGREPEAEATCELLLSPPWRLPGSAAIRPSPDRDNAEFSPMLAALLVWRLIGSGERGEIVPAPERRPLAWSAFAPAGSEALAAADFLDVERRVVSACLLENWLALQRLPAIDRGHFLLGDANYHGLCAALEAVFADWLKTALHRAGKPCLRLRPWPAGYRYALAIRYDVDRPVDAQQIRDILDIQRRRLNGPAGSWYFFADAPFNEAIRGVLRGWNQEQGIHCLRPSDAAPGLGATAHSGVNSTYWRGTATLAALDRQGAAYGEAMVCRFPLPRPGWSGTDLTSTWLTPLHFPLEGSTSDRDTTYFDQRRDAFEEQIREGGLVVIGSHPDCNQTILDDVLAREDLEGCWPTTLLRAVERARAITGYGNIRVAAAEGGAIVLQSRHTIADLAVVITLPDGGDEREISLQLTAGIPRALEF